MRIWYNPPYYGSLADACAAIDADPTAGRVSRIGLEVEGLGERAGERHTLAPIEDLIGFEPAIGEEVECAYLGLGSRWRVVGTARGYPQGWEFRGNVW